MTAEWTRARTGLAGHAAADVFQGLVQGQAGLLAFRCQVAGDFGNGAGQVATNLLAFAGQRTGEFRDGAGIERAGLFAFDRKGACGVADGRQEQAADLLPFAGHLFRSAVEGFLNGVVHPGAFGGQRAAGFRDDPGQQIAGFFGFRAQGAGNAFQTFGEHRFELAGPGIQGLGDLEDLGAEGDIDFGNALGQRFGQLFALTGKDGSGLGKTIVERGRHFALANSILMPG